MALAERQTIVAFGDSITQMGHGEGHWVARLQDLFSRRADVLNRGFSGFTTRTVEPLVRKVFHPDGFRLSKLLFTTVWLGANDASSDPVQSVPVEEYAARLETIVAVAREVTPVVVVMTPPPVDSEAWPSRSNEQARAFGAAARAAAERSGASCLDAFEVLMEAGKYHADGWKGCLCDGLHLSRAGGEAIASALVRHLEETHRISPGRLSSDFPLWREIDPEDPEAAFDVHTRASAAE
jgi:isoamyl acetate esterase